MYACIYYRKAVDRKQTYQNWLRLCKSFTIRFIYLTKPSDLPDIYKNHGTGLIPTGDLFCIANMLSLSADWDTLNANIPQTIIEPVRNLTEPEKDQLNAFFDARIKFKRTKKGKIYIEKQPGAPQLPSVQAELDADLAELRQASRECKQVEAIAYKDVLDSVCIHLFDLLADKYMHTITTLIECNEGVRRYTALRDKHIVNQFKIDARATAKKYCAYVEANIEQAIKKSYEIHQAKTFDCLLQFPTYAKYYHKPGSYTKSLESWAKDVENWFNKHYIADSGLKLIYTNYIELLTELGFTDLLQDTTYFEPTRKKARVVILAGKK